MGDTLITVVAIVLAAILMFGFPLMTMADRTDDVSQLAVDTETTKFVTDVANTGKLTYDKFAKYQSALNATGNSFETEMEIRIKDENIGKKTIIVKKEKTGENVYYVIYTEQILNMIKDKPLILNEGDRFSARANNNSTTIAEQLKNFFYKVAGDDTYSIAAERSAMVTANGSHK